LNGSSERETVRKVAHRSASRYHHSPLTAGGKRSNIRQVSERELTVTWSNRTQQERIRQRVLEVQALKRLQRPGRRRTRDEKRRKESTGGRWVRAEKKTSKGAFLLFSKTGESFCPCEGHHEIPAGGRQGKV